MTKTTSIAFFLCNVIVTKNDRLHKTSGANLGQTWGRIDCGAARRLFYFSELGQESFARIAFSWFRHTIHYATYA